MDADPSVYDSSPREMEKEKKRDGGRRTIKFIMFAYFMQREAKVYVKLTVRGTRAHCGMLPGGGRNRSVLDR